MVVISSRVFDACSCTTLLDVVKSKKDPSKCETCAICAVCAVFDCDFMRMEGTLNTVNIEFFTFLAAITGYVGLTVNMGLVAVNRHRREYMLPVALIVFTHVLMVWHFRYEWEIAQATRNGYAGFIIFHVALLGILAAPMVAHRHARWLVAFSFVVVAMGATGAVLRYDEVAVYRVPVFLCDVAGLSALAYWLYKPAKVRFQRIFKNKPA